MNYFSISALINALISWGLGIFILSKKFKSRVNVAFFLWCASVGLWSSFYFLWQISNSEDLALLFSRLLMVGAVWVPITLYWFLCVFLGLEQKEKKKLILSVCLGVFFTIFLSTKLMVSSVKSNYFGFAYWPMPGFLYLPFLVMFVTLTIYPAILTYRALKWVDPLKRQQIKYILLGIIIAIAGGSTNYFLWYGIPIKPYGNILVLFYPSLTAYAIIKYRFADIRLVIRRSAVFAILVLLITALYSLLAYLISIFFTGLIGVQSVILNGILTAVFVAVGFEPLKKSLSITTDRFLFKAEYNPEEVLSEFSDKLASTLDLEELKHFVVNRLEQVFKTTFVSLFLLDENKQEYMRSAVAGTTKESLPKIEQVLFNKIFNYLKKLNKARDILVRDEVKGLNEQLKNPVLKLLLDQLEKYDVNLLSPLYQREKLVGILFLGDRKSGDVFSTEDLRIIEIISAQSAVAMQNSKLYEEQKKFAIHLKKEVESATKELRIANIQLHKLDQAKSEFISIASHQLRTPLTVIKGYLSMIDQGDFGKVPKPVSQPLDRVYKSTLRIITLVEDLLNVSRIESGRMKYDFAKVDLNQIIADVYDELKQSAINKGLHFEYLKPQEKIPPIILDKLKIREVMMNLMDNAIKYSAAGNVMVKLERLDNHVEFSVSDNGRGIARDEMPQLFQKFSRAKGVQQMHTEGTGLGLYIAKQIIEKHGGEIGAKSEGLGKGSTFYIRFKIENKKLEREMIKEK